MEPILPGPEPTRPRRLTVLASIALILGAFTPIRLALEWKDIWPLMKMFGWLERYGFSFGVDAAFRAGIGVLCGIGGWGLLKRRSWAPLAGCVAGGAILIDSGYSIYGSGPPTILFLSTYFEPKYFRVALALGIPVVIHAVLFVTWYFLLRIVLRAKNREEFAIGRSGTTPMSLWMALVISGLLCALFHVLQHLIWDITPSTR